jgi:hypothetical protein
MKELYELLGIKFSYTSNMHYDALEAWQWTFGSRTVWLVNKSAGQPQFKILPKQHLFACGPQADKATNSNIQFSISSKFGLKQAYLLQ